MQQVKIFKSVESEISRLEADVNAWVRKSGAKIISIQGNIAPQSERMGDTAGVLQNASFVPSDVLLIVLYEAND